MPENAGRINRKPDSNAVWPAPMIAVLARDQLVGLVVVDDLLSLRIELKNAADACGDVAEVAER